MPNILVWDRAKEAFAQPQSNIKNNGRQIMLRNAYILVRRRNQHPTESIGIGDGRTRTRHKSDKIVQKI